MKKFILVCCFLFVALIGYSQSAQFRMVGNGSWTTVNDSTFTGSVTFFSDQTGNGFLANQIQIGYRLFTGNMQLYRVDSIWGATFSFANLKIVEVQPSTANPASHCLVFDPQGRTTIPQVPFGASGSTAQLQAAVDTWNASQVSSGSSLVAGEGLTISNDSIHIGGVVTSVRTLNGVGPAKVVFGTDLPVKLSNLELTRLNNSTGSSVINMTIAANISLPNSNDGTVKFIQNNTGQAIKVYANNGDLVAGVDSLTLPNNSNVGLVYNSNNSEWELFSGTTLTQTMEFTDSITNGSVTVWIERTGGSPCTLTNPTAGEYVIKVNDKAVIKSITVKGNNANLNASQELVIKVDNSVNNKSKRFIAQLYDAANNALVDQQITGTVHTQSVTGAITTLLFPGMNGFGSTGYFVELR